MKPKAMILLSLAVVLGLVVVGSGVLLVRGIMQFNRTEKSLNRQVQELRRYYERDPFPSMENVARERENAARLSRWLGELAAGLRQGQVEPMPGTPSQFIVRLSRIENALEARGQGVFPEGFAFGFDRYESTGVIPAPTDVPRLMQQLTIIDRLCGILIDSRVTRVTGIRREAFESGGRAGDGGWSRPDAGDMKEGALFAVMRFELAFTTTESTLLEVLNRLAGADMYAVVATMRISKDAPDIVMPAAVALDQGAPGAALDMDDYLNKDLRIVSGPRFEAPLQVTMELNVYRFAEPAERVES